MKKNVKNFLKRTERGQAIILIAFAFVGLVAMVGLVTDTGILLIEYGKLKRSVDAAAIAAAQEYRPRAGAAELDLDRLENAAIGMLNYNQVDNVTNIDIHTCEPADPAPPSLCNPDPVGNPMANRKLVEVSASSAVDFGFLRVIGLRSATLNASSTGEAATIDLVLVVDTSGGMAYETGSEIYNDPNPLNNTYLRSDPDDDPSVCNANNTCEPMRTVKDIAWDFVSHLYFPYDRVAVVAMTSQNPGGLRSPTEVIPLTSNRDTIHYELLGDGGITSYGLRVFQPRVCDGSDTDGSCLAYVNGTFDGEICEIYENYSNEATANPSSCPSSNIGGSFKLAREALQGSGNVATMRPNAFWVVVGLFAGPANATDPSDTYPNGFCPQNTWLLSQGQSPWCRDPYPSTRHYDTDPLVNYTNPMNGESMQISLYDADDYARDMADDLATLTTGNGVTI
ncbi:MAG: hypothetical protein IH588_11840, partial [Anaerolineales bacterium]|nr:hypothetical protein [Anaerolineales bacterium]